jgi:fatty acid desaturase
MHTWSPDEPPELEMTPEGEFRDPPDSPLVAGVMRWAILVAVVAAGLAVAAALLWFALMLVPVVIVAALVAWGAFRFRIWRARRAAAPGYKAVWRP